MTKKEEIAEMRMHHIIGNPSWEGHKFVVAPIGHACCFCHRDMKVWDEKFCAGEADPCPGFAEREEEYRRKRLDQEGPRVE